MDRSEVLKNLGPLAALAGVWEGVDGDDTAPSDDRGTEKNVFRERLSLLPIPPVDNHEQKLFGLRYQTTAWRKGENDPFHEESGYWLWEPATRTIMRCFIVPRGVSVLAGGVVDPNSKTFSIEANLGSPTFGICSNPFLDREFKTVKYTLDIRLHDNGDWSYDEDTQILMPGRKELFHHRDQNRLRRVEAP